MKRRTIGVFGVGALVVLSSTGCLTKTVLDHVSGASARKNVMTQPGSLARVVESDGYLWASVRYPGELSLRTLRIQRGQGTARAQFCQPRERVRSPQVPIVTAKGARRGVWLDGNELWEREATGGERCVARLPSLDDPLQQRSEQTEPLARRIVWAGLLPFAVVVDVAVGVPALLFGGS